MPDVPAVAETLPGYEMVSWFGVLGPASMPVGVVQKLNGALASVLAQLDVKKAVARAGFQTDTSTPEQFGAFIKRELEKWRAVASARRIKAE